MNRVTFKRRSLTQLAWLALFAVVLRSLVPAGFMLGQDAAGHNAMVFCHGIAPADTSEHGSHAPAAGKSDHAQLCSFAPSASPTTLHFVAGIAHAPVEDIVAAVIHAGRLPSESRPQRTQSSRGPPQTRA